MAFTEVADKATAATVSGTEFNTYIAANLNTGLWVPMSDTSVSGGGAPATVTLDAIPQGFYGLVLVGMLRSTVVATGENGYFRFNADTAANYSIQRDFSGLGTGGSADESLSATSAIMINMPGSTAPTATFGPFILTIYDYANTTLQKHGGLFQSSKLNESASSMYVGLVGMHWASTSGITRIDVGATTGFADGTRLMLYGIGGTL